MYKHWLIAALAFSTIGCASVQMGSPSADAQAKQFIATKDKAGIYIYRNETLGAAITMDVAVDNQLLGQTASKTYLYKEVTPGAHVIRSKAENTSELTIEAVAGKIYYVWQEVKMGFGSARSKLQLVDEATGQKGVKESKLAASNP